MSYEKQTWQTGDIVTSAKLNHMEDGIAENGGGSYIVKKIPIYENGDLVGFKLDKNYTEIKTAFLSGLYIYVIRTDVGETYIDYTIGILSELSEDTDAGIWALTIDDLQFTSNSATGEMRYMFNDPLG